MGLCTSISKGMLEPVGVVTLRVVGTVVCAATLCACQRTVYGGLGTVKQEAKLNRLNQLCIEGLALVLQLYVLVGILQSIKRIKSVSQATVVTLDKHPIDHLVLQRTAYRGCRFATGRGIEVIEQFTSKRLRLCRQEYMIVLSDELCYVLTGASSKDDQVHQGIGAQAIGAVHRDASHFARRVEARHRRPLWVNHHTPFEIGWNATHGVMGSWLDRHRLDNRLDAEVVAREVGDVRQLLINDLCPQVR